MAKPISISTNSVKRSTGDASTGAAVRHPRGAHGSPSTDAFFWPTPPFAIYGVPEIWSEPQACDMEAQNGVVKRCWLVSLDPAERTLLVQIGAGTTPISADFAQCRRITLKRSIQPVDHGSDTLFSTALSYRHMVEYQLQQLDGSTVSGLTVGYVETDWGLFVYTPLNDRGRVERVFIPREAFVSVRFVGAQRTVSPALSAESPADPDGVATDTFGEALIATPEQLLHALDQQSKMPMVRMGEALTRLGYVSDAQLFQALDLRKADDSVPLGQLLVNMGFLTRKQLNTALARKMGYPMVNVAQFPIEPGALRKIPLATAQRLTVIPLLSRPGLTVVAAADPTRRGMLEELEFLMQGRVIAALGDELQISTTLKTAYQKLGYHDGTKEAEVSDFAGGDTDLASGSQLLESMEMLEQQSADTAQDEPPIAQSDNSLVRLINTMIIEAAGRGVSDIHVESQPRHAKVRIRFRRDGALSPYLELPHTYRSALVARLKIMADLDISERRKPQDGKINFSKFSARHRLELRIATIPTANGLEDVVMRLLSSAQPMAMDRLGLSPANLSQLREVVKRPYGMVLCVGPTGSGKTTSLHSVLSFLNTPARKIWTAEDPIEITQPELRQVQVNPAIDWTFAKALRSFLRADPDVIMVGEIRDTETAHMAIEASLTGHLMLSTLHTNSAAETVTRLIDMGMNPFNFADSLLAVLAQRLVRRLCGHCKTSEPASAEWVDELLDDYLLGFPDGARPERDAVLAEWRSTYGQKGGIQRYQAPGCSHCQGAGLSGRLGLHELMRVTPGLRRLIQTSARSELVQAEAFTTGLFRTLRQDGISKVLAGQTTLDEVRANTNA